MVKKLTIESLRTTEKKSCFQMKISGLQKIAGVGRWHPPCPQCLRGEGPTAQPRRKTSSSKEVFKFSEKAAAKMLLQL